MAAAEKSRSCAAPAVTDACADIGYRGRFAPSPTGPLHFGSLIAALGSWLRARQQRGEWLIRIEDLDPPRTLAGASRQQVETLARFGMTTDRPAWIQSERQHAYLEAIERLRERSLCYRCACSRSDLAPFDGLHPPQCVASEPNRPFAWRARIETSRIRFGDRLQGDIDIELKEGDDFVLRRVDGYFAYQLAVVVDDAAQNITEVVRGVDLLDATPRQIWLQRALRLPTPAYLHLPLVVDQHGQKLSKSLSALPLDADDPLPALKQALQLFGVSADGSRVESMLERAIERVDWHGLRGLKEFAWRSPSSA